MTPELAVLSAIAHAKSDSGLDIAITAARSLHRLDGETARFYYDLVYDALPQAARIALEEAMIHADPEKDTPLVRKCIALGREQGMLRGQREALRTILESRGIGMSEREILAIESCEDPIVLRRRIGRAAKAECAEAVFEE